MVLPAPIAAPFCVKTERQPAPHGVDGGFASANPAQAFPSPAFKRTDASQIRRPPRWSDGTGHTEGDSPTLR